MTAIPAETRTKMVGSLVPALTKANATLTLVTVLFVVIPLLTGLNIGRAGAFADFLVFGIFWSWILGTPLLGSTALALNRRAQIRRANLINAVVLCFWFAFILFVFSMHGRAF